MSFCQNCGKKLEDGAKFCPQCGTPVGNTGSENIRKQEYVGKIKKCPSCGADVPSFNSKCTSCGHEFTETKIDNTVKEFFNKITELSSGIETASEEEKKHDITTYKLLLCIFSGLFLLTGFLILGDGGGEEFGISSGIGMTIAGGFGIIACLLIKSPLTQEEKLKRSIIETFVVPNNKESIIEFLMLSCSQIQPGANPFTKEGKTVSLWNKVWKTKIRQTITKSQVVLGNDKDAQEKIAIIKKQYGV